LAAPMIRNVGSVFTDDGIASTRIVAYRLVAHKALAPPVSRPAARTQTVGKVSTASNPSQGV
jgi:hypothetical protein